MSYQVLFVSTTTPGLYTGETQRKSIFKKTKPYLVKVLETAVRMFDFS